MPELDIDDCKTILEKGTSKVASDLLAEAIIMRDNASDKENDLFKEIDKE